MPTYNPYLSKTLFIKGSQCQKALWLKKYLPALADDISTEQQALFDSGTDVGILAQQLWPGGTLVPYEGLSMQEQLAQTQNAMNQGADTLYEASFSCDNLFIKADIMHHTGQGWNIYEVKASTEVKDVHLLDAAFQLYVLKHAGVNVQRVHIVHINNQYVRRGGLDVNQLFTIIDVTNRAELLLDSIPGQINAMRSMLQNEIPSIDIGTHCNKPYACEFQGHCWQHVPSPSVFDIARIGKKAFDIYGQGIVAIEDVPTVELNQKQRLQQSAWLNKTEQINLENVRSFLTSLKYPLCFMDFETFSTAVPLYEETRPYCQIPFQFSLHIQDTIDAPLTQREFLADGKSSPQLEFIEKLLESVPASGSILVWNQTFEKGRLSELQKTYSSKSQSIQNLIDRIVDLMSPFQAQDIYHWQFQGSYSIKKVLPVMAPELSYDSLDIQNGSMAPAEWLRMTRLENEEECNIIRKRLLEYCGLDTFAMVRILEEMKKMAI